MAARVVERRLGTLPWLVVRGPTAEAFASLGAHLATEIQAVAEGLPSLAALRRHVASGPGRHRFTAVRRETQSRFPGPWAELAALAAGAKVSLDDLALLNFRDQPPLATFAKPGFLPASTFTVTGSGLVWGIDHMQARAPGPGAGRHFTARGLQLVARSVDEAISYLRQHPSAGGFAYTIGDRAGRIVTVESSAGQHAWREIGTDGPVGWHTNHGRYIPGADASPHGTSLRRGKVLAALDIPAHEPEPGWFLRVLTSPPPGGVRAEPTSADPTTTLCTFVADLTGNQATIIAQDAKPVTVPLSSLTTPR